MKAQEKNISQTPARLNVALAALGSEWTLVIVILLAAACFRFYRLDSIPLGEFETVSNLVEACICRQRILIAI